MNVFRLGLRERSLTLLTPLVASIVRNELNATTGQVDDETGHEIEPNYPVELPEGLASKLLGRDRQPTSLSVRGSEGATKLLSKHRVLGEQVLGDPLVVSGLRNQRWSTALAQHGIREVVSRDTTFELRHAHGSDIVAADD